MPTVALISLLTCEGVIVGAAPTPKAIVRISRLAIDLLLLVLLPVLCAECVCDRLAPLFVKGGLVAMRLIDRETVCRWVSILVIGLPLSS